MDASNQLDAERIEFGEAARLNPGNNAATHFNHGVLLAKQGRLAEAERALEETLRLQPAYPKAREYLAELQRLKKIDP